MQLESFIKSRAKELGFAACGISNIEPADSEACFFDRWIGSGYNAGMKYMENHRDLRLQPTGLLEGAKSIISVALNYYPEQRLPANAPHIAYYAYGKDYHIVVKAMLTELWESVTGFLSANQPGMEASARVFTDSAPILERYWAWKAGLGWIGKNCNLIIPGAGSFFFLGEIVTTLSLEADTPQEERCGSCRRCLDACPTKALEAPRRLDANRCFSYLTIENREDIPLQLAKGLDGRLFGCDTCQTVCPWNKFAKPTHIEAFKPSEALYSLDFETLRGFSKEDYNRIFAKSAVKRAKYEGLVRTIKHLIPDENEKHH